MTSVARGFEFRRAYPASGGAWYGWPMVALAKIPVRISVSWPERPTVIGDAELVLESIGFRVHLPDVYARTGSPDGDVALSARRIPPGAAM